MGTQQLLLLVVGIIVVIITIYVGYNIYNYYLENSNRDQLISILNDITVSAQQHFKKAKEQGGGGGSFSGWTIPKNLDKTDAGSLKALINEESINLTADGIHTGRNNISNIKITGRIDKNGLRITVIN